MADKITAPSVRSAARAYIKRNYRVTPVPVGEKAPVITDWPNLRVSKKQVPEVFRKKSNIGLLLGPSSSGLIDVDVDAPEALALARDFLPATKMIHGRRSRPRSHFWYIATSVSKTKQFGDVDGTSLVEIRSTGAQTIVPPSVHKSGELIVWKKAGNPARVKARKLHRAVAHLASCTLVARHWPGKGAREKCALALGGTLLRAGWTAEQANNFVALAARAADDEEWHKRGEAVEDTARRLAEEKPATGLPMLLECLGDKIVTRLIEWLQLERSGKALQLDHSLGHSGVEASSAVFRLRPLEIVRMEKSGDNLLRVRGGASGDERTVLMPVSTLSSKNRLATFVADRFGHVLDEESGVRIELKNALPSLTRATGSSRLGWTSRHDAFLYGRKILASSKSSPRCRFVAPDGTVGQEALQALTPAGSRNKQYRGLQKLREQWPGRLVLALASVSPFLELVGVQPIIFHLAGKTGFGKTCLFWLGVSLYGNPRSSLLRLDISKDTGNYVDSKLGLAHNFPLLLDETTLMESGPITTSVYRIAVGLTKGRLGGTQAGFLPTERLGYSLVCFLSGEHAIRGEMDHLGGEARLIEMTLKERLFSKQQIREWYAFASRHYGWFGRDLIQDVSKHYRTRKSGEWAGLRRQYEQIHRRTAKWCKGHGRTIDCLAVLELGDYLAARQLGGRFKALSEDEDRRLQRESRTFTRKMYDRMNTVTKPRRVLRAIQKITDIREWAKRGFIPCKSLKSVGMRFGLKKRGSLAKLLRQQNIISTVEARKVRLPNSDVRKSRRSYILTPDGQKRLSATKLANRRLSSDK